MTLPLVDTFSPPCEIWEKRPPTLEEMREAGNFHQRIPTRFIASIANAYDAATHMAKVGADNDCDFAQVSAEINAVNKTLSDGQCLFHGGQWPINGTHLLTDRPLSTSFCPQVALRNAEHNGKAYDAGWIDLFVLKAVSPKTKVFAYRRKNTSQGHENEVVFAAGADLWLKSAVTVNTDYQAAKYMFPDKQIVVRVLEIDIS